MLEINKTRSSLHNKNDSPLIHVKENSNRRKTEINQNSNRRRTEMTVQTSNQNNLQSPIKDQVKFKHWFDLRFQGPTPERRGYHTTFIHNGKLFIHGGYDIKEGSLKDLWVLDLSRLDQSINKKLEDSLEREGLTNYEET